jgi:hypothetical protein
MGCVQIRPSGNVIRAGLVRVDDRGVCVPVTAQALLFEQYGIIVREP